MAKTLWGGSSNGWSRDIVITGDEGHKQYVPEGKNLLKIGSFQLVGFEFPIYVTKATLSGLYHYKILGSAPASQFFIPMSQSRPQFLLPILNKSSASASKPVAWLPIQSCSKLFPEWRNRFEIPAARARSRYQRVTSVWQTAARPDPWRTKCLSLKPDLSISWSTDHIHCTLEFGINVVKLLVKANKR